MSIRVVNNFDTTLATGISDVATSMTLASTAGAELRGKLTGSTSTAMPGGDYLYVTLADALGNIEIVKITALPASGDVVTIVRAQDGTSARAWSAGAIVDARPCAAFFTDALLLLGTTATAVINTPAGGIAATNVQSAINELDAEKQAASAILTALAALSATAGLLRQTGASTFDKVTETNIGAGKHSIWVPAGAMLPDLLSPPVSSVVNFSLATKPMIRGLTFPYATWAIAHFNIRMPKSWNEGTITFVPVWEHGAAGTPYNVVWSMDASAFSDNNSLDLVFSGAVNSADTGGVSGNLYQGPESSALTVANTPAANDLVQCRVYRNIDHASDTMAYDATLLGVMVFYTTDTNTDA